LLSESNLSRRKWHFRAPEKADFGMRRRAQERKSTPKNPEIDVSDTFFRVWSQTV
jgi:hypothetical protein